MVCLRWIGLQWDLSVFTDFIGLRKSAKNYAIKVVGE
jgi:hypothetical protein